MDKISRRNKIMQDLIGPDLAAILYSALELNLPELLTTPKSIEILAEITGAIPEKLEKTMIALKSFGFFSHNPKTNEWTNSRLSSELLIEALYNVSKYLLMPYKRELLCSFTDSLRVEESAQEIRFGCKFYEYLTQNATILGFYEKAMAGWTNIEGKKAMAVDLSSSSRVLDLGGGDGSLLINIALENPHITGSIFEIPENMSTITKNIENNALEQRLTAVPGNFFDSVPEGYDCILLKNILVIYTDADCVRILKNCRNSLKPGNKIKWFEGIKDKTNPRKWTFVQDVGMMAWGRGRVRTNEEMEKILNEAGFRVESFTPAIKKDLYGDDGPLLIPASSYYCTNAVAI
ncbi:unnamed protein product [Blepharisma stoltei]|uniref:O-methyltransferase C-terminal domain-containing protein n=1 Tax=Blepharisma stoltei TaxID=1481888 RepID=A0AAU9J0M1_9CILI|nr:unnamed protein product [Blepharisma stoltei]